MEMTGLQIFKYLPASKKLQEANCKKCGCPTCMAFALKLAKQNIDISKCPHICDELQEKYTQSSKHPQKTIEIENLKIGGENVLYRHEKTFINRTTLAVIIDCNENNYKQIINEVCNFEIKIVNEILNVDLIILKNIDKIPQDIDFKNVIPILYDNFKNLEIEVIENNDFETVKNKLKYIREKSILEKDDNFSSPVGVLMKKDLDIYSTTTQASYYICKYANIILFEEFDTEMFSTLMSIRQNIFTDPQKTLQVESGLYKFNNPDKNSIIFMTTNFALTYFAVANELESLDVPSYLIVIPADGMSVLTAWSAQTFTAEGVAKTIKELNIKNIINTRKIIIPGLLSVMKDELHEESPDFEFIEGTHEASAIGEFVKNYQG